MWAALPPGPEHTSSARSPGRGSNALDDERRGLVLDGEPALREAGRPSSARPRAGTSGVGPDAPALARDPLGVERPFQLLDRDPAPVRADRRTGGFGERGGRLLGLVADDPTQLAHRPLGEPGAERDRLVRRSLRLGLAADAATRRRTAFTNPRWRRSTSATVSDDGGVRRDPHVPQLVDAEPEAARATFGACSRGRSSSGDNAWSIGMRRRSVPYVSSVASAASRSDRPARSRVLGEREVRVRTLVGDPADHVQRHGAGVRALTGTGRGHAARPGTIGRRVPLHPSRSPIVGRIPVHEVGRGHPSPTRRGDLERPHPTVSGGDHEPVPAGLDDGPGCPWRPRPLGDLGHSTVSARRTFRPSPRNDVVAAGSGESARIRFTSAPAGSDQSRTRSGGPRRGANVARDPSCGVGRADPAASASTVATSSLGAEGREAVRRAIRHRPAGGSAPSAAGSPAPCPDPGPSRSS